MSKSIKIIPFKDIENSFIVISCRKEKKSGNGISATMSFVYGDKKIGAEWEPDHGAITTLLPCDKHHPDAQKHWFYPYYTGQGYWSQLAVENEHLPEMFLNGDYEGIFNVLKKWASN